MFNAVMNRRNIPRTPPPAGPAPLSTPYPVPLRHSPGPSPVALIESSPRLEIMDQTREYASAPSTPTPKATKFPSGQFSTILPMPSLNLNIGSSLPIKRNKRRTFDEHSIDSQEAINRANSIELLKSAKKALLQSFVLDQNPQTAIVIDNVNSLISKKVNQFTNIFRYD